jgi:hypothetical protein
VATSLTNNERGEVEAEAEVEAEVEGEVEARSSLIRKRSSKKERSARNQVRFCRGLFPPTGDLGSRGVRGAVGLGYRFTVYKRTLPRAPSGGGSVLLLALKGC